MDTTWTQGDFPVGDVRLHYYRTGHGDKRPLVLVHGFSDNGLCWSRTARDLEGEYDVVMPDMRGHGLSERMRPGDVVDMAADLAGLILGLGLKRPIVAGHSMGAAVTYQTCMRFPDLVAAAVLEDPPWWLSPPFERSGPSDENPMSLWARGLAGRTLEELLTENRAEHPSWPDETIREMAESKKQLDQGIIDELIDRLNSGGPDWLTGTQDRTQPVLLLTADAELGAIVTPEIEARVHELNPTWTIVNIPDVGHLIHFDKFPAYMEALRDFLKEVPA
jgi:pimeloyl-ACP methyl ester carboxylesterase